MKPSQKKYENISGRRRNFLDEVSEAKPVRIVPVEEVARRIYSEIAPEGIIMPTNVVTPEQRAALERLGVRFVETNNKGYIVGGEHAGKTWSSVYGKKAGESRVRADYGDALYDMNVRKEKTRFGLTNVGSNDHVSAAKRVSGYKVKDLIHSTQEADKKLLGITTETGGRKSEDMDLES